MKPEVAIKLSAKMAICEASDFDAPSLSGYMRLPYAKNSTQLPLWTHQSAVSPSPCHITFG